MTSVHAWLPRASCDESCVRVGPIDAWGRVSRLVRGTARTVLVLTLLCAAAVLAIPQPAKTRAIQLYTRILLRCMGMRITNSGSPIRNVPGVLVVSPHISWADALVIYTLVSGNFVAKAELIRWPGVNLIARMMKVIPIERTRLRRLPGVVETVAERLRAGQTVVAFPEGTTWCGLAYGEFRPAIFQAAIDAGRPVQPLRLSYHCRDGRPSTSAAFVGRDTLVSSFWRLVTARATVAHVHVEELQLPGEQRRDLALRCQVAVRDLGPVRAEHALVA